MSYTQDRGNQSEEILLEQAGARLKALFKDMPLKIPVYLFKKTDKEDIFSQASSQVIRTLQKISDKIILHEYEANNKLAKKWNITHLPTILFDPGKYDIRWLGAPIGEEGRTLIEALLMLGYGTANLSEQSRKIAEKIKEKRRMKLFVSPTCPYCPQQAVNTLKAALEKPDLISLEIIDIQANPDIAEEFSAHSVPLTYAEDKLIAKGAQSEELFFSSLEKMEQQSYFIPDKKEKKITTDLVIVGGGPAGLTAGIYASRSGINAVLIEKDMLGGQVAVTPVVENYPGMTHIGGKTLVDLMVTHALEYVNIFLGEEVLEIIPGSPIKVVTSRRIFSTKAVLLCTGANHKHLEVKGEQRLSGYGVSYCSSCDGLLFKGKTVIVVGGGNSAATDALHLHNIGVNVTLVHRKDQLRAQEHLKNSIKHSDIPILFNTEVKEIRGDKEVEEVLLVDNNSGKTQIKRIDGVFISIGYQPNVDLAQKINVELTEDGYIKTDLHHRTNVPGVFAAGDVEGGYKQIVTAAGRGSEAALSIFEDLIHPYWMS